MPYRFTLEYPPTVNHYLKHSGPVFLTREAQAYKETVGWALRLANVEPLHGALAVTIRAYRPRRKGDIDGILKVALDAMNKLAYDDDKQIVELHVYRYDDKHNPRLEVEIKECS